MLYTIAIIINDSRQMQTSFLETLIGVPDQESVTGDVVFPRGFEVRNFEKLRRDFEALANRYGLTLPAKLKKGQLVLEWKPFPEESSLVSNNEKKIILTEAEVSALNEAFE